MLEPVLVALGAAVGAPLRWWLGIRLDGDWPRGTLLANIAGAFGLGLASGWALSGAATALWATGFCGAFTTYSSFAVQVHDRGRGGVGYAVVTVIGGVGAALAGFVLTSP